ncbi:MAG: SPOR domain-containing protein [Burkholderiales bacterium]|nr:SPOR domain-containing protein [Burkholderiales bacterium]
MTESALMPAPTDFSHTQQPAPSAESAMGTLYRAALGPIRPESYLPRFERFDALGRTQPGWNWAASLCTLNWMALRHLWTPALIYVAAAEGLGLLLFGAIRALLPWPEPVQWGLVGAFALLAFALPGLYGDAILHTEIRKRIARALASTRNLPDACAQLEQQAATPRRLAGLAALNAALLAAAALAFWFLPQTSPADAPAQPPSAPTAAGNVAVGTASAPEIHPIAAPPAPPASAPASTPTSTASDAEPTPLHAPAPPAATPPASAPVQQTAAASTPAPKASAPAPKASTAAPKASAPPTMTRTPAASSAKPPGPAAPAATRRAASAPAPAASAAPRPTPATTPRKPASPAAAPASSPAQSSSESVPAPPDGASAPAVSAPAASASDSTAHAPAPSASNAPPPAVGRTPGYYINVGLFAEEANARKAQAKLLNAGLPAFRQSLDTPKGQRIRVRVGPYPSAAQAQAAVRSIKALQLDAVVFQQSTSPE